MAGNKVTIDNIDELLEALAARNSSITKSVRIGPTTIPGIGTGVAYTAGDAFGAAFSMDLPKQGIIHAATFVDKDDEGIETDLVLFNKPFTGTADNEAFTVSDADMENCIGTITFATFKNFAVNQMSTAGAMGLAYIAPEGTIYIQAVTRGAPNIAAGASPMVSLVILSDE